LSESKIQPLEIDPLTLNQQLQSQTPPAILDVREGWEVELGTIAGAMTIPLGELTRRVAEVPRDRPLVVFCHHGGRSAQATGWLRLQGFDNASNLVGGVDAWSRLVDPSLPQY
jgi:rhodanese-related sulfurtransferase